MQESFKVDYDSGEDILFAYNSSVKSSGSVELGELVIDLDRAGEIVALEVFNASSYLSELTNKRISKELLKKMEKALVSFTARGGTTIIKIFLQVEKETVPATIAIQNMHYKSPIMACVN